MEDFAKSGHDNSLGMSSNVPQSSSAIPKVAQPSNVDKGKMLSLDDLVCAVEKFFREEQSSPILQQGFILQQEDFVLW